MRRADAAAILALGYLTYRSLTLAVNGATLPVLVARPGRGPGARVSLLIPARDEAATLPETLPLLLAQGAHEVIVLDDSSTDATAQVARALGARVIPGRPLPPGWSGKTWACHQLAEAADGDLLVFTDADVRWQPGALAALAAELARTGADLLSVWPRQENTGLGQRLLTPMVDAAMLGHLPYPFVLAGLPGAVAANGQVITATRTSYDRFGGHAAVPGEVNDDMALAGHVVASGGTVRLALGGAAIGVRMYDGVASSIRGLAKSTPGLHHDSRPLMLTAALWFPLVYTLPWLLPGTGLVWLARLIGLADRSLVALVATRTRPADLAEGLLGPVTPLAAWAVYARALRRRITWRGREYPRPDATRR